MALHFSPSPNGFTSNVGFAQNLSNYRLNRVSRLRVYAKKEEQDPKKSTQSLFSNITEALDFSQARSQEDAQLLEDAREATRSGSQMSREQYGSLRRKIGGTYKDFFKSYVDVYMLKKGGWTRHARFARKIPEVNQGKLTNDNLGRYVHVACLEKAHSGNFFSRRFSR